MKFMKFTTKPYLLTGIVLLAVVGQSIVLRQTVLELDETYRRVDDSHQRLELLLSLSSALERYLRVAIQPERTIAGPNGSIAAAERALSRALGGLRGQTLVEQAHVEAAGERKEGEEKESAWLRLVEARITTLQNRVGLAERAPVVTGRSRSSLDGQNIRALNTIIGQWQADERFEVRRARQRAFESSAVAYRIAIVTSVLSLLLVCGALLALVPRLHRAVTRLSPGRDRTAKGELSHRLDE